MQMRSFSITLTSDGKINISGSDADGNTVSEGTTLNAQDTATAKQAMLGIGKLAFAELDFAPIAGATPPAPPAPPAA